MRSRLTVLLFVFMVIRYSRMTNDCERAMLKSQDILVSLKLASLALQSKERANRIVPISAWRGWEEQIDEQNWCETESSRFLSADGQVRWTYADLSQILRLSASECNAAVKRGLNSGLLKRSLRSPQPLPAARQLIEFLVHGLKYVFPVKEGRLARGVPTAFGAPVLQGKMLAAGEHEYVWEDARGLSSGLSIEPLHKSVPFAVRSDPVLYELLALTDAIRFGKSRESALATEILTKRLMVL